ncbi:E3 ubiquitin-protein ligase PUB23-like [Phragmites australis]|uniref:E3 ubiquitin-protein ligase PUB23-like n=1 Tax=Phragmites australis TaxID=29695 RepID=UPI002D795853|nr:E3 ubiquitin-protein ligase PUB23-like [Phragmites australis]
MLPYDPCCRQLQPFASIKQPHGDGVTSKDLVTEMEALGGMQHHFLCPISLQLMQDPVTAPTGITYDRRAIERWLAAGHATCPVTGQPLALADLTPNHTLRRLIQSWRPHSSMPAAGATSVERERQDAAADVVKKLLSRDSPPSVDVLRAAAEVTSESDVARRYMVDAGVLQSVLRLVVSCAKMKGCPGDQGSLDVPTVEACLALVRALDISGDELLPLVADNHVHDLVDAVTDVLVALETGPGDVARASAVQLLESVTEVASVPVLGRLRPELFRAVTAVARDRVSPGATRAALRALLQACPVGRNRALIVEAGAAHEAIELELAAPSPSTGSGGRRVTELTMALLAELCACADGRAAVAAHPAGIAVVTRRLLRVSGCADACAVRVLAAVGGRAASPETLWEMVRVGVVGKLCCVLQADCDAGVKEAARAVLRLHSAVWSGSPCVSAYLLSRYL